MSFLKNNKIQIFDSAIGTELIRKGIEHYPIPEVLNIATEGTDVLKQIYEDSIVSGADFITSNSFNANQYHLGKIGLDDEKKTRAICKLAIDICRNASKGRVKIAGSVGPLDIHKGNEDISYEDICDIYRLQVTSIVEAGADLLILETFANPDEASAVLDVAAQFKVPTILLLAAQRRSRAGRSKSLSDFLKVAAKFKVDVFGVNCAPPHIITEYVEDLCNMTDLPIMVSPNAGTPKVDRGVVRYQLPSNTLIQEAEQWYNFGVKIFGGCCGTNWEHIKALADNFKHRATIKHVRDDSEMLKIKQFEIPKTEIDKTKNENNIRKKFNSNDKIIAVEMRFESNCNVENYILEAQKLKQCGCNVFTIPDNPGANIGIDSMTMAAKLQTNTGVDTIFHKSATHTNLISLYSALLAAWETDLRAILAVSGDPPATGNFSRFASRITDIKSSVEFLKLIKMLEEGICVNNQQLKKSRSFFRACAFAPQKNTKAQIEWLTRKIAAGAEAAFTQPYFTKSSFIEINNEIQESTQEIRILNGIFPIMSAKQAKVLSLGRIPGIVIPEDFITEISKYSKVEDQKKFGIEQAINVAKEVFNNNNSIYIILPFGSNRFDITRDIINHIN